VRHAVAQENEGSRGGQIVGAPQAINVIVEAAEAEGENEDCSYKRMSIDKVDEEQAKVPQRSANTDIVL